MAISSNRFVRLALMGLEDRSVPASAGTLEGVGIGAGTGAVIAGPPGAVVGGVIGAVVGGPNIIRRGRYDRNHRGNRHCWSDRRGDRHCSWR